MKVWNLCFLVLRLCHIAGKEHVSSHVKDVKAHRRLLAAILGYRKEDTGFISDVIRVHNKYRRVHGCNDLSQCARLRQQAGRYAQTLADKGAREPQKDPKLEFGIGENIYISCGHEVSGEEAVNFWYNEACNYFGNKKSFNEYKHFAQVIWKPSYLLGVGRRTSDKSGQKCTYVVARYRPRAEQGPAEFTNIPKGNFDDSICSGNAASSGSNLETGENIQPGTQPAKIAGESRESLPANGQPGAETVRQPESSQPARAPNGAQFAGSSRPSTSMGSSEGGTGSMMGQMGSSWTTETKPDVTPTSVPGTGDRERATDPENSHISPLIEENKTGPEGSIQETEGKQESSKSTPYCPPCPGDQAQTQNFETPGGAEMLPESQNNPRSNEEGEKPLTSSKPQQMSGSTNPVNPSDQANNGEKSKPVEQVHSAEQEKPGQQVSPAEQGKPGEQVNSAEQEKPGQQVSPAEQSKPVEQVNSAEQGKPGQQVSPAEQGKPGEQVNPAAQAQPAPPDKPPKLVNPIEPINPSNPDKPSGPQTVAGATSAGGKQSSPCVCPNQQGREGPSVGVPEGSQENQPQTSEGSENLPSGRRPEKQGLPSGNEVSQGEPSGKEVSQVGSNEGNVASPAEVKPSGERGPGGNVAPSESTSVSSEEGTSKTSPGSQGNQGKTGSQGVSEGSSGTGGTSQMTPGVTQPAGSSQPSDTGRPSGSSEGTGVSSGGSEGEKAGAESVSQSSGKPEGHEGAQGEGSMTHPESTSEAGGNNAGSVQGGQSVETQGKSGQPEGGAFVESLGEFQQTSLDAHNKYRQFHKSVQLTHNNEMSAQATEYAQKLAASGINNAEHSLKSSRENQGENVYAACGTNPSGADVTKEWYKELCNYDYNKHDRIDAKKPTGHFTQIIWKSSTEFGIGRAYGSNEDCVYIVARYKPAGNIIGSESSNIERGTMDSEYCGREFVSFNNPENANTGEQLPGQSQPESASEVGQVQPNGPNHNSIEVNKQESGIATESNEQNTNPEANIPETINTGESNQPNANTGESNQPNANTDSSGPNQSEATSNSAQGGQQSTRTDGTIKQSHTNPAPSPVGGGIKRIKTPYLPGYLQKEVLEDMNKRYRGLRTDQTKRSL